MRHSLALSRGSLELVTPPATEPVTVTEAKAHARIETTADDTLLEGYITGARELVERTTHRALITQTWRLTLDCWPGSEDAPWFSGVAELPVSYADGVGGSFVEIRKAPFLAISSVQTLDESDTATTWASSNYYVDKRLGFGRLIKKQGVVWPTIVNRDFGAIRINFTAGYGTLASTVPVALRQAIKDIVAHWYENREAAGEGSLQVPPMKTTAVLQRYTVGR
jgi:gp6-like head-tail connector protein